MTNEQIRLCIEKTAADCIHSLTMLAAHMSSCDDIDDQDVALIHDAARSVAGVLIFLRDDFADEPYGPPLQNSDPLHTAMVHAGLVKSTR